MCPLRPMIIRNKYTATAATVHAQHVTKIHVPERQYYNNFQNQNKLIQERVRLVFA